MISIPITYFQRTTQILNLTKQFILKNMAVHVFREQYRQQIDGKLPYEFLSGQVNYSGDQDNSVWYSKV